MAGKRRVCNLVAAIFQVAAAACSGPSSTPAQPSLDAAGVTDAPETVEAAPGTAETVDAADAASVTPDAASATDAETADAASSAATDAASSLGTDAEAGATPPCPKPPFDTDDPAIQDRCTRVVYAAGGYAFRRTVSFDGATWNNDIIDPTATTGPDEHAVTGMLIVRGILYAVGDMGLFTSVDGVTWAKAPDVDNSNFKLHSSRLVYGSGVLVIASPNGGYYSLDGLSWTWVDGLGGGGHLHGATYGAGQFVGFFDNGMGRTSADGKTWTSLAPLTNVSGLETNSVAFGNGAFVGFADTPAGTRLNSADGLVWQSTVDTDAKSMPVGRSSVIFDGTVFRSTGTDGTSVDGVHWVDIGLKTADAGAAPIAAMTSYAGHYLATPGWPSRDLYVSDDGVVWTQSYSGAASAGNGMYTLEALAVGRLAK